MSDDDHPTDQSAPTLAERIAPALDAQAHFDAIADRLSGAELAGPSLLPEWSRAHVVAHVAHNAEAMVNLVDWADTGVPHPMYASPEARNADIDRSAGLPADELVSLLHESAEQLHLAWGALPAERWSFPVSMPSGVLIPVGDTVRLRTRELWLHAVDLDAGTAFEDLPPAFLDELLAGITAVWADRLPPADRPVLRPTDRDPVDGPGDVSSVVVRGTAARLASWATGRGSEGVSTDAGAPPEPPAWM